MIGFSIKFIDNSKDFVAETIRLRRILKDDDFPNNVFVNGFISFKALEFDLIYYESIFEGIKSFLGKLNNDILTFYTLLPSPEEYFFNHFNKYSIAKISVSSSYDDYISFLNEDPGESPADALITNSETFALYSDNTDWGIICSRECEIVMVGFKNKEIENKFLTSFDNPQLFSSINSRIEALSDMLNFPPNTREFYSDLERNYQSV